MTEKPIVADTIRRLRRAAELSQKELSEKLQVTQTAVASWESGRNEPNIDTLKALAQIFGVSVDALIGHQGMSQDSTYDAIIAEIDTMTDEQRKMLQGIIAAVKGAQRSLPSSSQKIS